MTSQHRSKAHRRHQIILDDGMGGTEIFRGKIQKCATEQKYLAALFCS